MSKKQHIKEKYESILDRYGKKIGIKSPDQIHYVSSAKSERSKIRDSKEVGDVWQEGEYWVEKLGKDTYSRSRHHPDVWRERAKIVDSFNRPECKCGKKIKNENEKVVFRARGKCFDCLVAEETDAIAEGREYKPRVLTKNDMIIKDSMGRPIMSIAELEEELGVEMTIEEINQFSKKALEKFMPKHGREEVEKTD